MGGVRPQYHVVFDDEFRTVPYMEAGTIPPNWEALIKYSYKMATAEDINLEDTWLRGLSNEEASDPITGPIAIVTAHHKRQKTSPSGHNSLDKTIPISASEGGGKQGSSSPVSQSLQMNQAAANSFANTESKSPNGRA